MKENSIERGDEKIPGWDALLNSDISQQSVSALSTTYKVLNVDRIYQQASGINHPDTAYGATTAAMIMDYYHDVIGYNL